MPIETASNISQLVATNPAGSDLLSTVDNHVRLIKSTLLSTFPGITGLATQAEAEAGTSTVKLVTPLSVKQAITANQTTTTAGTYTKLTVDTKGRITGTSNITWADMPYNPTVYGTLTFTGPSSIEIGQQGVSNSPYIDFHSGATNVDYDSRISASGGNGMVGKGTLNFQAATHAFNGSVTVSETLSTTGNLATSGNFYATGAISAATVNGPFVATQSDAIAATSSTKVATPLSVKQYVDTRAIGENQIWYDLTSSRTRGTSYQNTTGRTIVVNVSTDGGGVGSSVEVSIDGTTWITLAYGASYPSAMSAIVPQNYYYRANGSDALYHWAELR